jgi:hypothetical protein
LLVAALVAACGGDEEPTPEPPPAPTATTAAPTPEAEEPAEDAQEDAQAESPLDQPRSPLLQPESPLTVAFPPLPTTEEEAIALAENTAAPEPTEEGLGSLSGVLWTYQTDQAIYGIQTYLVPAVEFEGNYITPALLQGPAEDSVTDIPNPAAQVLMNDVPPGHYYMVVWTIYNWIFVEEDGSGAGVPRLITVEEGDQLQLGVLYMDWP